MSLDYSTVHFCNALINASFGVMFLAIWHKRREIHYLFWSASLLLISAVVFAFTVADSRWQVALLLGGVGANVTLVWAGVRAFDNRKPLVWPMAIGPLAIASGYWVLADFGEPKAGSALATTFMALNVVCVGRCLLGQRLNPRGIGRAIVAWVLLAYVPVYLVSAALSVLGAETTLSSIWILVADFALNNVFVAGLFLMAEDRIRNALQDLASRDQLTGAFNRTGLFAQFGSDPNTRSMAFLLADLDHFKSINDKYGHAAGDAVLRAFVSRMKQAFGSTVLIGRLGGEEFGLAFPGLDRFSAATHAETVRRSMADHPVTWEGQPIVATVSIGVAVSMPGEAIEATMRRADEALYRAKNEGRNRIAA